jgi:hypothetical protein
MIAQIRLAVVERRRETLGEIALGLSAPKRLGEIVKLVRRKQPADRQENLWILVPEVVLTQQFVQQRGQGRLLRSHR